MKTGCLFVSGLCFLGTVTTSAQTAGETPWLTDSSRAIQFGIGNYFNVQTFDGKSISLKAHLKPLEAVRVAVSASGSVDRTSLDVETYVNDTLASSTSSSSDPVYSLTLELAAHYLWYIDTQSDVFLFLGTGPQSDYMRRDYTSSSSSNRMISWSFGASAAVGAEWFAARRISLHAEYQAAVQYTAHRSTRSEATTVGGQPAITVSEYHTTSLRFVSERVIFGLSIYF